uniref:Uncharacterized protein n=1 Tax=Daphnia magna TaxID=35525 RepID=A0A0P5VJM8_9CRUS
MDSWIHRSVDFAYTCKEGKREIYLPGSVGSGIAEMMFHSEAVTNASVIRLLGKAWVWVSFVLLD